jgi:hypothetical protein
VKGQKHTCAGASSRAPERDVETTRAERIDYIVRAMTEGRWSAGKSHQELAERWGLHPRTVSEYAGAASAIIDRMGTPLEDFVEAKLAELETMHRVAMSRERLVRVRCLACGQGSDERAPDPDVKGAAEAVRLQLQARGALVQRHEVAVRPYANLSEAELAERMAARLCADHLPIVLAKLAARGFAIVEPPKALTMGNETAGQGQGRP